MPSLTLSHWVTLYPQESTHQTTFWTYVTKPLLYLNIQVITLDQRNDEKKQESLQRIEMFTQAWINLEKSRNSIADPLADQIPVEADQSLIARSEAKWPSTWFNEFLTLLERNLKVFLESVAGLISTALRMKFETQKRLERPLVRE